MATAWFGPCPHCRIRLSYLQGVSRQHDDTEVPRLPSGRGGHARDVSDGGSLRPGAEVKPPVAAEKV